MNISDKHKSIYNAEICPYCGSKTEKTTETEIYGREYKGREMIKCVKYPVCNSYVGTHEDGEPLGRLANKELRMCKKKAHDAFDNLWRSKGGIKRSYAYQMLAEYLEIDGKYCHIGMFKKETCIKVIAWSKLKYAELI